MNKDNVFADKQDQVKPFEFNENVTRVFDDMLNRSVPFYKETIHRQSQMARSFYQEGTRIYDMGCSHGNLGIKICDQFTDTPFTLIGVDSSRPMIDRYAARLKSADKAAGVHLVCGLLENLKIENASVVLINLTLQFLDIAKREELIQQIYQGLVPGGILLLTEKTVHPDGLMNDLEQSFYKRFKLENGYSELEISQKREALEKVLIPDTPECHEKRLKAAGFKRVSVWLKWFNFSSILAVK